MTNVRDTEPEPFVIPLNLEGTELVSFDMVEPGGWAAYFSDATESAYVLLRVAPEDGPPLEAVFEDGRPAVRFPINHAEGQPFEVRELHVAVRPHTAGFASSLLREIPFTRIEAAVNHPLQRRTLARMVLPAGTIGMGSLPAGARFLLRPEAVPRLSMPDLKVDDPGGYRKPDRFYEQVADLYLTLAAVTGRPAQELAAANGVPVGTVHRWVKEAKARRLLLLPSHRARD